jgi:hypothetical protein
MATTEATVIVGQITPDDNESMFLGFDPEDGVFNDYVIENRYFHNRHAYMLGVTSPGGFNGMSAAFVCLAAPTMLWVSDWTAMRTGRQPPIPNPAGLADGNWIFLYALPVTRNVALAPDGISVMYRISGTYVYGKKNPAGQTKAEELFEDVRYGRPPWANDNIIRKVDETKLENNLIETLE